MKRTAARTAAAQTGLTAGDVVRMLREHANPAAVEQMARFGIRPGSERLGLSVPQIKAVARQAGRNHALALELWKTGIDEARFVAAMIGDPARLTDALMERWARDFHSWDTVDGTCCYLFHRTPLAWRKAMEWSAREEEFVKRAGFALMSYLAVHDKQAADAKFRRFLPVIEREADDDRNFVKKAVNWALRQIGKRNAALNRAAIACALRLQRRDCRAARWIAADALRELRSDAVREAISRRQSSPSPR